MSLGGAVFMTAALIAYAVLLYHAIVTRGRRVGIGFFVCAAVLASVREFAFTVRGEDRNAYQFHFSFPLPWVAPLAIVGWSITPYLAWCIAEAILRPWPRLGARLFVTLAVAFVASATISLAVEPSGVSVGLWTWRAFDVVKVRHPRAILAMYVPIATCWALFSAQILGAYWFFFGSSHRRYRTRFLALLFLLIPRAVTLAAHEFPSLDNRLSAALRFDVMYPLVIVAMALFISTSFDWPAPNSTSRRHAALPLGVGLVIVVVLLVIDYLVTTRADIALSKIPLFIVLVAGAWSTWSHGRQPATG
ncbi:MAG: hypothetical protein HY292_14975 [Planctomycetes bacterium]|nr:hypothetical protein [Planctomycetota bacterium]